VVFSLRLLPGPRSGASSIIVSRLLTMGTTGLVLSWCAGPLLLYVVSQAQNASSDSKGSSDATTCPPIFGDEERCPLTSIV
jgi:hypothetical protein